MHLIPTGRLLEELGCLYGSGKLADISSGTAPHANDAYPETASCWDGRAERGAYGQACPVYPARLAVADDHVIAVVLGEPQDDAAIDILAKGRASGGGEDTW